MIATGERETGIQNLEDAEIGGLTIGCTPARHYSGRSLNDRFATLWASWVFRDEYHQVYESGDSSGNPGGRDCRSREIIRNGGGGRFHKRELF